MPGVPVDVLGVPGVPVDVPGDVNGVPGGAYCRSGVLGGVFVCLPAVPVDVPGRLRGLDGSRVPGVLGVL